MQIFKHAKKLIYALDIWVILVKMDSLWKYRVIGSMLRSVGKHWFVCFSQWENLYHKGILLRLTKAAAQTCSWNLFCSIFWRISRKIHYDSFLPQKTLIFVAYCHPYVCMDAYICVYEQPLSGRAFLLLLHFVSLLTLEKSKETQLS